MSVGGEYLTGNLVYKAVVTSCNERNIYTGLTYSNSAHARPVGQVELTQHEKISLSILLLRVSGLRNWANPQEVIKRKVQNLGKNVWSGWAGEGRGM